MLHPPPSPLVCLLTPHHVAPPHIRTPSQQEIYGKLEEPDGLAGLMTMRKDGPRLQDQIMACEKAGCWNEALALYELALHSEPTGGVGAEGGGGLSSHQRGHLQCLLQMGHLQVHSSCQRRG